MLQRKTSLDKKMSPEEMLEFLSIIEGVVLPETSRYYLKNFFVAYSLLKFGAETSSKKVINYNQHLEETLGKYYFVSSIINQDTEKYGIAKKFIGEKFDPYSPVKIKVSSIKQLTQFGGIGKLTEIDDYKILEFKKHVVLFLKEEYERKSKKEEKDTEDYLYQF